MNLDAFPLTNNQTNSEVPLEVMNNGHDLDFHKPVPVMNVENML